MLENTLESPLDCKEIKPVNYKGNQSWIFIGRIDAEVEALIVWPPEEELTRWKRPWCLERLKAGGEGDYRGWDGWMALLTQWTWVWAIPGVGDGQGSLAVLQSMGSQRVGHDWVTQLNWTDTCIEDLVSNLAASALFFQAVEASRRKFTIFRKIAKTLAVSNWNQVFLLWIPITLYLFY